MSVYLSKVLLVALMNVNIFNFNSYYCFRHLIIHHSLFSFVTYCFDHYNQSLLFNLTCFFDHLIILINHYSLFSFVTYCFDHYNQSLLNYNLPIIIIILLLLL